MTSAKKQNQPRAIDSAAEPKAPFMLQSRYASAIPEDEDMEIGVDDEDYGSDFGFDDHANQLDDH